jgi:Zn-dependent protease
MTSGLLFQGLQTRRYDERVSEFSPRPELEPDFRQYDPIQPRGTDWRGLFQKIWAPIAVVIGLAVKFGFVFLKFFGIFISVGAYALIWGWKFGVGFVLLILVHEMGHFVEAKRQGLEVTLPTFVPFLGAYVLIKNSPLNPWRNALVALAGPAAGGAASALCWGIGEAYDSRLLMALAYAGFLINLFNLIPIGILDGGAIWNAYKLARMEPVVPEQFGGAAVALPGSGRNRAALILVLYLGLAGLLVLGMIGAHVPQSRL